MVSPTCSAGSWPGNVHGGLANALTNAGLNSQAQREPSWNTSVYSFDPLSHEAGPMDRLSFRRACTSCVVLSLLGTAGHAAESKPGAAASGFAARTKGFTRRDGLLVTWLGRKAGKLLLELPRPSGPRSECGSFLLLEGIETG